MAKILLLLIVCFTSGIATENGIPAIIDMFGMKFLKAISDPYTHPNGTVISALSIQHFLALWATATKDDNTLDDFDNHVLFNNNNRQKIIQDLARIPRNLTVESGRKYKLDLYSKLYVTDKVQLTSSFKNSLDQFDTNVEPVDFEDPEAVVNNINEWISEKSNKKIVELVKSGTFDANTSVAFVSAVYFHAVWQRTFANRDTVPRTFQASNEENYKVQTMYKVGDYRYADNKKLNAKIIEIPYTLRNISMFVVLPSTVDGLPGVLEKLSNDGLLPYLGDKLKLTKTRIFLPKFRLETELDVMSELRKLGLRKFLNSSVENLLISQEVQLNNAIQKTVINIDESGTEAESGSGVLPLSGSPTTAYFTANKPFMFFIMENDILVFAGTLLRPTPAQN